MDENNQEVPPIIQALQTEVDALSQIGVRRSDQDTAAEEASDMQRLMALDEAIYQYAHPSDLQVLHNLDEAVCQYTRPSNLQNLDNLDAALGSLRDPDGVRHSDNPLPEPSAIDEEQSADGPGTTGAGKTLIIVGMRRKEKTLSIPTILFRNGFNNLKIRRLRDLPAPEAETQPKCPERQPHVSSEPEIRFKSGFRVKSEDCGR